MSNNNIRFDSGNIEKTFHPHDKSYGFLNVNEAKTPFIRKDVPMLDPHLLRERLAKIDAVSIDYELDKLSEQFASIQVGRKQQSNTSTLSSSMRSFNTRARREHFRQKRKQFDRGEYSYAMERWMPETLHPPMDDIPARKPRQSIVVDRRTLLLPPAPSDLDL